jgi:DNA-binding CsgD family transcriptional regulator
LDLVADAESAESIETYHAELLASMAAVFPCDVVNLNDIETHPQDAAPETPAVICTTSPPIEPAGAIGPALLAVFVRHMAGHPLVRLHAAGDLAAHRLSDTTSMRSFRRAAIHGEFFGPVGLDHQLSIGFDGPPGRLLGIWASRARRDFSEDELILAELLRPHLSAGEIAVRRAAARAALTRREREVLDLVATGATNAAVAEALTVSRATVKKHLDNIYEKLGVGSRAAAADRARSRTA